MCFRLWLTILLLSFVCSSATAQCCGGAYCDSILIDVDYSCYSGDSLVIVDHSMVAGSGGVVEIIAEEGGWYYSSSIAIGDSISIVYGDGGLSLEGNVRLRYLVRTEECPRGLWIYIDVDCSMPACELMAGWTYGAECSAGGSGKRGGFDFRKVKTIRE